jgi:pantoate--beta-alanine ligase
MVTDLAIPVDIVGLKIVREGDGLAMSSRNGYLSSDQRAHAPVLFQSLKETARAIALGDRDFPRLEKEGQERLRSVGFRPDYYLVRNADNLAPAGQQDPRLVILAAAYLGATRLIDNLRIP